MKTLPIEFLHECFELNAETGDLIWKVRPRSHFRTDRGFNSTNARSAGKSALSLRADGYHDVVICCRNYLAHRIIFAMVFRYWPDNIDHIDGNKSDSRPSNLRACLHIENVRNQGAKRTKGNKLKGAYWHTASGRWHSTICVNYKQIHLGYFETPGEAHAAYVEAAVQYHGAFANAG